MGSTDSSEWNCNKNYYINNRLNPHPLDGRSFFWSVNLCFRTENILSSDLPALNTNCPACNSLKSFDNVNI